MKESASRDAVEGVVEASEIEVGGVSVDLPVQLWIEVGLVPRLELDGKFGDRGLSTKWLKLQVLLEVVSPDSSRQMDSTCGGNNEMTVKVIVIVIVIVQDENALYCAPDHRQHSASADAPLSLPVISA